MGKTKKGPAKPFLIDLYRTDVVLRPLLGLNRFVKLDFQKRNGVLHCDNVATIAYSVKFSDSNARTSLYTIHARTPSPGFIEARLNATNVPLDADLRHVRDEGTEVKFSFAPKRGKTYRVAFDVYKLFEPAYRYLAFRIPNQTRIKTFEITLDVSAYLTGGYSIEKPRSEYEPGETKDQRPRATSGGNRRLHADERGPGVWGWSIDNPAVGGSVWLGCELGFCESPQVSDAINLKKLATELSVNPRLAKDLHNFVIICHYYAAGFRSLNKIGPEMVADRSVLNRGLELLEETIGAELIHRTKRQGLIQVTPAGEAVLDWWSQFYMRWTPVSR